MQSLETKGSRPRSKFFETETRLETFETPKNGCRDQVSRLHPCNARFLTMPLTKDLCIEELARRIEVNDDEHSLFMALRLGYC